MSLARKVAFGVLFGLWCLGAVLMASALITVTYLDEGFA